MVLEIRPDNTPDPRMATPGIFLAGGITGAGDWQSEAAAQIRQKAPFNGPITVFNPRRENFDVSNKLMSQEQISWENLALLRAKVVLFWFPKEAACPITLLELGRMATMGKLIAVGVEPGYVRELDVYEQLSHMRPEVPIHSSLRETVAMAMRLM